MITRSTHPQFLIEGLRKVWGDNYKLITERLNQLFSIHASKKAFEVDYRYAQFGPAQLVLEGVDIPNEDTAALYENQFNHDKFGLGFEITDEMLADDQYNEMKKLVRALNRSMRATVEILAAKTYNDAFATAGYDGKALCATDHPMATGGTGDNKLTAALDALGLEAGIELYMGMQTEEGFYIDTNPTKLVVPSALVFTAKRLLRSIAYPTVDIVEPGSAGAKYNLNPNDKNILGDFNLSLVADPYFTDTNNWFLRGTTGEDDGLMWFWRMMPDLMDWYEKSKRAHCYNSAMRLSRGHSDWRNIVGSEVA